MRCLSASTGISSKGKQWSEDIVILDSCSLQERYSIEAPFQFDNKAGAMFHLPLLLLRDRDLFH
jgi:hypothetical protein